jgi:hypothetical protein
MRRKGSSNVLVWDLVLDIILSFLYGPPSCMKSYSLHGEQNNIKPGYVRRWNSRTNSWVEVSGHNLESS